MDVTHLDLQAKLRLVLIKAATLVPADVGQQLLALITPQSLATMAGIVVLWAGAHFLGVGEIADIILLIVGWAAIGGVAVEAGKKLYDFAIKTHAARSEMEIDDAAKDLAEAITLIGINTVFALLLRKKPDDVFNTHLNGARLPKYTQKVAARLNMPKNSHPGWRYRPKIRFTKNQTAGNGETSISGDITIGRNFDRTKTTAEEAAHAVLEAIYHERVHQFIAAKFYLFRESRAYLHHCGYYKSYILRYLEETLAETIALLRANGVSSRYILEGFRFPLGDNYQITYTALRHEAAGILLGPVTVGGAMYNVYYGVQQ
ncbi:Holin [Kosakonia sp. BK9b]